jgi:hypothetical protein
VTRWVNLCQLLAAVHNKLGGLAGKLCLAFLEGGLRLPGKLYLLFFLKGVCWKVMMR